MSSGSSYRLTRNDDRVIVHFDYDCFYASVFEAENPSLKSQPLAVQQKQIIVTCNYEARRRGLHKLQLITEAKRVCPDAIILLGEDLTRFRDASKSLYNYLRAFSWSDEVEKLGFDEVWMDVTALIDYNIEILNNNDLHNSFFCTSKVDPTQGFSYDATKIAGHSYPASADVESLLASAEDRQLTLRLLLGSHLAQHIRFDLEEHRNYTATVGVGTSKLISKLVGNLNKPRGQTTLLPPYRSQSPDDDDDTTITSFLDAHDIGAIPGIGFKVAQKLREHVLERPPEFADGLVYGPTREKVTVGHVRTAPGLDPEKLESLLCGPGMHHGIGLEVYRLIRGIDNSKVKDARNAPQSISIEDSYIKLNTYDQIVRELNDLTKRLIDRMRCDLMYDGDWFATPRRVTLTTRPRPPLNADGTRTRNFQRICKSAPFPLYVLNEIGHAEALANKMVENIYLPLFRQLHPKAKGGWDLSLVNVAVDMIQENRQHGRDISSVFKQQEETRREFERDVLPYVDQTQRTGAPEKYINKVSPEPSRPEVSHLDSNVDEMEEEEDDEEDGEHDQAPTTAFTCDTCGMTIPSFAKTAHDRYHDPD